MAGRGGSGVDITRPRRNPEGRGPGAGLRPPAMEHAVTEQALVVATAALTAVYVLSADGDELRLTETAGGPRALYGLPTSYPLSGRSPVADAFRTGRPQWST